MESIRLIAKLEKRDYDDDDDYDVLPVFSFKAQFGHFVLWTMTPEEGTSSKQWDVLVDAVENGRGVLDWGPSNGCASITVGTHITSFEIAKYGDGQGGSLHTSMLSAACKDAFTFARDETEKWEMLEKKKSKAHSDMKSEFIKLQSHGSGIVSWEPIPE